MQWVKSQHLAWGIYTFLFSQTEGRLGFCLIRYRSTRRSLRGREGPSGLSFRALRGGAALLAGTCLSCSAPDSGGFDVGEQSQQQEAQGTLPSWGGVGWGAKGLGNLLRCEKRLPNI